MITESVAILDKLAKLTELRATSRRKALNDHVEPLFNELTSVHNDYVAAFRDMQESIHTSEDTSTILAAVQRKAAPLGALRVKIHAYASQGLDVRRLPDVVRDFFWSVLCYFGSQGGFDEILVWDSRERWAAVRKEMYTKLPPARAIHKLVRDYHGHYATLTEFIGFVSKQVRSDPSSFEHSEKQVLEMFLSSLLEGVFKRWEDLTKAYAECRLQLLK